MSKKKRNSNMRKKDKPVNEIFINNSEDDKVDNEKVATNEKTKHIDKQDEATKEIKNIDDVDIGENDYKKDNKLDVKEEKKLKENSQNAKGYKHPVIHGFMIIVLLTSLAYFIVSLFYTKDGEISTLINSLLLMVFTLLFVSVSVSTVRKNKNGFFLSALILFCYFVFGICLTIGIVKLPNNKVIDFTNMKLTDVIKWSEKYKINIIQDYEYSDMIDEYHIISQSVEAGTKLQNIKDITVAVSEGANPFKEVLIPDMISWDSDRVLEFIKKNHLSNVSVEFVESTKIVNTVIEQNKRGNIKRNDELKLVFSAGEEIEFSEVTLRDLTNLSKFEAIFYLKQNHLNYEFKEVFSSKIKRGYVASQSIEPGKLIKTNDEKIIISISKGAEIKVPDLVNMTMTDVTEWVVANKLKLEFTDKYDDTVKENSVISANVKKGDIVAEGDVIKIVISRGKLLMKKFDNYNDFREWADKYQIKYEEQHQFSDSVSSGEVISYSYNDGDVIKNNDSIIVVISDGKEAEVPSLVGSTKNNATNKLKNLGFNYNYIYKCNNSVANGNVVRQSIGAGSKVAKGTTITLTISTGKCSSGNSGNSGGNTPPPVTCDTSKGANFFIAPGNTGTQTLNATKSQNPGFTIKASFVASCSNGDSNSGTVCNSGSYDGKWLTYCNEINLVIVQ